MNQEILIIKKENISYVNMSKTASASEEPNLFELFRAPKVFETKPQRAPSNQVFCPVDDAKVETKKSPTRLKNMSGTILGIKEEFSERFSEKTFENHLSHRNLLRFSVKTQEALSHIDASVGLCLVAVRELPIRESTKEFVLSLIDG